MKQKNNARLVLLIAFIALIALSCGLLIWDLRPAIASAVSSRSWEPLTDKFASYGFWTFFFIGLANTILVVLAVLPGHKLDINSGINLVPLLGTGACLAGRLLGNLLIYIMVRKLKTTAFTAT